MNQATITNLTNHGFEVYSFETEAEVKAKVLELVPQGSEIMTMTSTTLNQLGLSDVLNSDQYHSIRTRLMAGDAETKPLALSPEFAVGSVHAVTESGELVIASATGSQLPAYVYGAKNVIFVVSTQKIVPSLDAAFKRIYDYVLPLENERALKAYGVNSSVNKLLILNQEPVPGRTKILFVNQKLGF